MSVNSFFVKPTLPAPIIAILKLMILTFKSIEQAAAGKSTAFSSMAAAIAKRSEIAIFPPIAVPRRRACAVFWRDYAYNHGGEQRTIMLLRVILCCKN
jgi:hypothetical protein